MAINAEQKGEGNFKKVEAGTYPARCYRMIELGTQAVTFEGTTKMQRQVMITWELPSELETFNELKGLEPFSVSKIFSLSMHEKATLRIFLQSWRGKAFTDEEAKIFDVTKLIGKECLLNVIHKPRKDGGTSVAIASVSTLPKGYVCPAQLNESKILSFDNFDWDFFNSLSDWAKDTIKQSKEFKALQEPQTTHTGTDEIGIPDPNDNDLAF